MLLSLIKRLRSRRRSYLCAGACSVNGSLASLIFKAHLKLKKRQLYEFFVELISFLNFRSFLYWIWKINLAGFGQRGLKCSYMFPSLMLTIYMTKLNTYFIFLFIYRLIKFVRQLLALCENEMINFYYRGHRQWHIDVLKFRPTSIFCSDMLLLLLLTSE